MRHGNDATFDMGLGTKLGTRLPDVNVSTAVFVDLSCRRSVQFIDDK